MRPEKLKVKVTTSHGWAIKGEVHEVGNYITFGWGSSGPHFEKWEGSHGISLDHCEIFEGDPPIKLKLNDECEAEVIGDKVKVGCQEFEIDKIRELMKKIDEWKEK